MTAKDITRVDVSTAHIESNPRQSVPRSALNASPSVPWQLCQIFDRILKGGGGVQGEGVTGTLRNPREDWGTLGNSREY